MRDFFKNSVGGLLFIVMLLQSTVSHAAPISMDAIDILRNLSNQITPWFLFVQYSAYVVGISLFFKALYHLKVYGELRTMMSRETSLKTPLTWFAVGAAFVYFPTAVDIALTTTYGEGRILMYPEWRGATSVASKLGMVSIFRIVQFVGLISFIRGMMIISKAAQQGTQARFGKGLTHVIAGIIGLNIVASANLMAETLGVKF